MPLPLTLAHQLVRRLSEARRKGEIEFLRPDGKSQVTVEYEGRAPDPRRDRRRLHPARRGDQARRPEGSRSSKRSSGAVIPAELLTRDTKFHINPTGRFVIGGPQGDSGLTGRKIIVDTYGGSAPHGGGAFSGKDPTKVDRSAAYMARYVAKNVVAAGLADRVLIQLAYAIGVADPVSVHVETYGTGKLPESRNRGARSRALPADAPRDHRDSRPAPADLQGDGGVRPLRPTRILLGAARPGRRSRGRSRRRSRRRGRTGGTMSTAVTLSPSSSRPRWPVASARVSCAMAFASMPARRC